MTFLETVNELRYRSPDGQFGFQIDSAQLIAILGICGRSPKRETGGILVGFYSANHDNAIVTVVTGPPVDSKFGKNWFYRGVMNLQRLLERLWFRKRQYYLGEWHYHPSGESTPSQIDVKQMTEIAQSPKYHCPEPVLLIIGNNLEKHILIDFISVFIFISSGTMIQLQPVTGTLYTDKPN
jgi:integrative and conjugative element protein (TIGR02256 family)